MITTIKFAKLHKDAIIPTKRKEDAGMDLYAAFDTDFILILPNSTEIIPTGLTSAFDSNYALVIKERSSTGIKGMGIRAGIIDSGYRGDIGVAITNHNQVPMVIVKDNISLDSKEILQEYENLWTGIIKHSVSKAIAQALIIPVPKVEIEECTVEEISNIPSERGDGAYGSSGK